MAGGPHADTLAISGELGAMPDERLSCVAQASTMFYSMVTEFLAGSHPTLRIQVLSMMEKVPAPSETPATEPAPAYNLPPGYEDVAQPRPESRASLAEGRPIPSRPEGPRVAFAGSAPHSTRSLPSPGPCQSAQGATPQSTPSLPAADAAFLSRSQDHGPQPRELPSNRVHTSLPIFPPLATNPQQPQPQGPPQGPAYG
ncbi:unnamed protein product [Symbiodinium natans]|uniref:Uncharacterized protein n=1 Tax=Symbiodinium natans TaxID=878477 RepID=A0A812M1R2_9DINO|nr:unnamed protein product [Symbiodinium natans]